MLSRNRRLALLLLGLGLVVGSWMVYRYRAKEQIAMLSAVLQNPRYIAFILRSYTGSRQHLIVAAAQMLLQSKVGGDPKEHGKASDIQVLAAGSGLPEHLIGAASYFTKATIQDAVAAAAEVERRLEDPAKPGARETIRIDLVWVQNVELQTPLVTLPHPELWANGNWAYTWRSSLGIEAFPTDREALRIRDLVENADEKQRARCHVEASLEESTGFYRKPEHNEWRANDLLDLPDALSALGDAVQAAAIEREIEAVDPRRPVDPVLASQIQKPDSRDWSSAALLENSASIQRGFAAVKKRVATRLDEVVLIRVVPKANAVALQWASEVQAAARRSHLRVGKVVVTSMGPGEIRGLALGQKQPETPPARVEILGAEILPVHNPRSPGNEDSFSARLSTRQLLH